MCLGWEPTAAPPEGVGSAAPMNPDSPRSTLLLIKQTTYTAVEVWIWPQGWVRNKVSCIGKGPNEHEIQVTTTSCVGNGRKDTAPWRFRQASPSPQHEDKPLST